ncbi:hypothetical protein C3747_25g161 [Trypanosoma cruzi]|uniref:Uncharacterized protein n=2 Tax=Trypanosoma cruzi TaxID=5693 RepID=Q4DT15_TRYCC|nr:hypothetical protein, conserved [Trypanosoma cruzi]EAN95666.1 hypothetical protein, conserved [Trypanosoma cruzi]PWV16126.1 hypothetical protein C3747_25g161 [Trypanosoma cruzi]RNC57833.1 hypothetical protein TcCL_ESM04572 [Trypanosoma cruzi]|eukprot:XP_817517.1 hypothetical protein [Trypanosoma cruzi strain CL Brener]
MSASGSTSKDASPYVCLSAHCDLLHFIGPVPHPYGGPNPQTIAQRASQYVRFSCESCEKAPTVTVKCEHPLFPPIPVTRTTDGVPSFPLTGIELARWAYRENFESVASQPQLNPHEKKVDVPHPPLQGDSARVTHESAFPELASTAPLEEPESTMASGRSSCIVNFHALRRIFLQTLFILNLPHRSPAVSFRLSLHDPRPFGVTSFFLLPRCAEKMAALAHPAKVTLTVARTTGGDTLQCSCDCLHKKDEEEDRIISSQLLWELKEGDEREQYAKDPVELDSFLTGTMIPVLFALPEGLAQLIENKGVQTSRAIGWSQRRSFHLLALIAHCVWCEKVAWCIMSRFSVSMGLCRRQKARLKLRNSASLESTDKWESTLFFYPTAFNDDRHQTTRGRLEAIDVTATSCAALIQVTVWGCDEEMEWEWNGETPHASSAGLCDFTELLEKKRY